MATQRAKRWCFTINNYTNEDLERLVSLGSNCTYLVYGRETGDSGTPHLQGFVIFNDSTRFNAVKSSIGSTAHIEPARGSNEQASKYCKKDGDFEEYGEFSKQGKRTDWDDYRLWVTELERVPSRREIANRFPSLYARYSGKCLEIASAFLPSPNLVSGEPRFGWQTRVSGRMEAPPNPRSIDFVVDPAGNSGKSWLTRWAMTKFPDSCQVLRIGKRDDIAYSIDETKSIFLFDVPRTQMEFLQYSVLESLKDQLVFSPKYDSRCKILNRVPYVCVFSNEAPDLTKLTEDRFNVINV